MTNREKVIKGLECCQAVRCDDCNQSDKSGYPWDCEGFDRMINEALDLLKAQEPEFCTNTNEARIFSCSECGFKCEDIFIDEQSFMYPSINYCPNCGKKVKWDE